MSTEFDSVSPSSSDLFFCICFYSYKYRKSKSHVLYSCTKSRCLGFTILATKIFDSTCCVLHLLLAQTRSQGGQTIGKGMGTREAIWTCHTIDQSRARKQFWDPKSDCSQLSLGFAMNNHYEVFYLSFNQYYL